MAQWLNKLLFVVLLLPFGSMAQDDKSGELDYKNKEQYERYMRRRKVVAAWQINQLRKNGAIVVRLRSNQLAVNGLLKKGKQEEAQNLAAQTFAINKNTMMAYIENFKFCKVYFIYGSASDSLLKGTRKGIFLDTNLVTNDAIEMQEKFYLLAERDYAYNSSIGFVTEAEAEHTTEKGNAIKQMAIVLKNKYGHQLKNPFPHEIKESSNFANYQLPFVPLPGPNGGIVILFSINRAAPEELEKEKQLKSRKVSGVNQISIPKHLTYYKIAQAVEQLNYDLFAYYQHTASLDEDKLPEDVKPFLY